MADFEDEKTFSHRLIELMDMRRMTVREAAEAAGVAVSSLQNWRAGHQPSNFKAIKKKLAEALGTTLEYLLIGDTGTSRQGENEGAPGTILVRGDIVNGVDNFNGIVEIIIRRE